jgi:chromate transporter
MSAFPGAQYSLDPVRHLDRSHVQILKRKCQSFATGQRTDMEVEVVESHPRSGSNRPGLREVALLFLKLGVLGFGGPAAHIAMMEDEVVRRKRWFSREEFLDLLGATNLIPGPNSTELAIHIGRRQAGWPGLICAGACFILPATLIVSGLAWAYVRFGSLPQTGAILYGVKPVVIAVILQALWRLRRTALKTKWLALVAVAGIVLGFLGVNELVVLFGAGATVGVVTLLIRATEGSEKKGREDKRLNSLPLALIAPGAAAAGTLSGTFGLWPLFLFFLKVGSVLFGSGYVLLVFLRADLVERWQWLTEAQLLDAIAVGQMIPGPVFTTATFIGYLLGGPRGAVAATVGIFLPAFLFVAASAPLVSRIRRSAAAGAVLDGVNAASLSLMALVTYQLGRAALVDVTTVTLLSASLVLLVVVGTRLNSAWLVLGGATIGLAVSLSR